MKTILLIALRNLFRQKRRNLLLGIAIAFGAMILVAANSFSYGITDVLFNRIIKYANGHVSITYVLNGNLMNPVFPDSGRIWRSIRTASPRVELAQEALGLYGRAIGNGKADNIMIVGIDLKAKMSQEDIEEYESNFKFLEGDMEGLKDPAITNPTALAESKAKYLKVKIGDIIQVRFNDANNQAQSAALTVVGIFKPANIFMSFPIFVELQNLRTIGNFGPHDIASVQVNIKNPRKEAGPLADRIHEQLKPGLAVIPGTFLFKEIKAPGICLGFRNDTASHALLYKNLRLTGGDSAKAFSREGAIASFSLARAMGIKPGDTVRVQWKSKFDSSTAFMRLRLEATADAAAPLPGMMLLVNEKAFYKAFYRPWPEPPAPEAAKLLPDSSSPIYGALAPEYVLLPRYKTTEDYMRLMRESGRTKFRGINMSVSSMYESASAILKLEAALNVITLVAVLVLFFIILIGVVNTLRMTIRERTREIGTIRAIGMQKKDVRNIFILETFFLALFASLAGLVLSAVLMWGLSLVPIDAGDNPMGMLLVKGHLYFEPMAVSIIGNVLLILIIAVATAFFPARRAANMPAADALRHFE